ncbi:hypothetical protein Srufu_013300 [Streptomyces libani subsp. rufus]|nr:hypothetical protein Srufu_013300 [Streptomyces libani subsp. rufus]
MAAVLNPVGQLDLQVVPPRARAVPAPAEHRRLQVLPVRKRYVCQRGVNFRSELVFVRAFYQDIARWAADDPARWAPWVAPCPIKASECATKKSRSGVKSRMDQRTRGVVPVRVGVERAAAGCRGRR